MKKALIILIILSSLFVCETAQAKYKCYEYYKEHTSNKEEYERAYKIATQTKPSEFEHMLAIGEEGISREAFYYVTYDHPEILWSNSFYGDFMRPYDNIKDLEHDYDFLYAYINNIIVKLGKMKGVSKYQKIKKIHNFVSRAIKYKSSYDDSTRSLGRVLVTGKGCCVAYAKLFKLLCDYYEIKSIYIANSDHAFNYVEYKNKWYGIDCCWDNDKTYNWFMYGKKEEKHFYEHTPKLWFNFSFKLPTLQKKKYKRAK